MPFSFCFFRNDRTPIRTYTIACLDWRVYLSHAKHQIGVDVCKALALVGGSFNWTEGQVAPKNNELCSPRQESVSPAGAKPGEACWKDVARGLWHDGAPHSQPLIGNHTWKTNGVSPAELDFMQSNGGVHDAAEAKAIKAEIETVGSDPEQALLKAAETHRVLGFADMHVRQGPYFQLLIDELPKLREKGVTDLAVEIPQIWQPKIETWTDEDRDFLKRKLVDGSSLLNVIDEAKKLGINVTAVDEYYQGPGDMILSRDRTMANKIIDILKNPDAKICYLVGAEHLADGMRRNSSRPTTAQILQDNQVSISTFYQQLPSLPDGLMISTRDLAAPKAVNTSEAPNLGEVKTAAPTLPPYKKWNNVIFYPPHYKMESADAELNKFGTSPKESLEEAVQHNQVLLLGEMSKGISEFKQDRHRQLIASIIPSLKRAGLTDLALDIPKQYQKQLDKYSRRELREGFLDLPEPFGGYGAESFRPVLRAALHAHLKLHAVGQEYTANTPMQSLLDGLSDETANISKQGKKTKTLLWTGDEFVAKFYSQGREISVANELKDKGVTATAFADFSPTQDKVSPGIISSLLPEPTVVKPSATKYLREVVNNRSMQMDRFDNVIIYPDK